MRVLLIMFGASLALSGAGGFVGMMDAASPSTGLTVMCGSTPGFCPNPPTSDPTPPVGTDGDW